MYSPFCYTTFCHFSGSFIIPSPQNFLSFWAKNCSRCLLQSSRELTFFPLREYCKDWNKWKTEVQRLLNIEDESELPNQAVTIFAWSSKKHAILHYPDGRLCVFCWLIVDTFCRVLLSFGLIGSSTCWNESFGFPEKAHIIEDSQSHHIHNITFFGWRPSFGAVGGGSFHLPHDLFCSALLYSIHFSLPITICLKNGTFLENRI